MKDKYLMTIVGIQHYVKSETKEANYCTRWAESLSNGMRLTLQLDEHNRYAIRCFAALMNDEERIGSLSCDYVDEAELLMDPDTQTVEVEILRGHHKCIDVTVPDPEGRLRQLVDAPYVPRITTTALEGIPPLRLIPRENVLNLKSMRLLREIDLYIEQGRVPDEPLISMFEQWLECYREFYHKTLCREDHIVWKRLRVRLDDLHLEQMESALRQRFEHTWEDFSEMHRHITQNRGCLEAMNHQLTLLRQMALEPDGLIDQYQRVFLYEADEAVRNAERERINAWLRAIPYNIYSFYHDRPELLASNLYYARLSRQEIYRIYAHLLVLEYLDGKLQGVADSQTPLGSQPHLTSNMKVRIHLTYLMNVMFNHLRKTGFLQGGWDAEFVKNLLGRIFLDKISDTHVLQLREQVWTNIENMRSETMWQELKLNRPMEVLGYLLANGYIEGTATQLADKLILLPDFNLTKSKAKTFHARLRKYIQTAEDKSKAHDYTPIVELVSHFVPPQP